MLNSPSACAVSAPPIDPSIHRHIRLRRLGLQGATARLIGELAFGPAHDHVFVVPVADAGTQAEGVRQ